MSLKPKKNPGNYTSSELDELAKNLPKVPKTYKTPEGKYEILRESKTTTYQEIQADMGDSFEEFLLKFPKAKPGDKFTAPGAVVWIDHRKVLGKLNRGVGVTAVDEYCVMANIQALKLRPKLPE